MHEAFLKLDGSGVDASRRGPFLALAAKAMRCVLVDHVRARAAAKRGGGLARVTLATGPAPGIDAGRGAYAGMAMNTAGLAGQNRVGVGGGGQGGEAAMAIGYQRILGTRASLSLGAVFGGGEESVMGGAGFSR